MGGIIVWFTLMLLAFFFFILAELFDNDTIVNLNFLTRQQTYLPLGVLLSSALIGLIDDFLGVRKIGDHGGGLRLKYKLLIYTLIALVGAYWFYFKLDWNVLHLPFIGTFQIGIWYIPIFIFIIVATAFSVNETDGLDGLAGGVLLSAFASYAAIAFIQGKTDLAAFCAAIAGALLAYLTGK